MVARRFPLAALALVLAVAAVYGQTVNHAFVSYDDDIYIFNNPVVTAGLTWPGFLWAFGYYVANWHPLTWFSHMLDCQLFGLRAGGHHLVSAGIHAGNAVLLLAFLRALTGAFWRSAAVAAIFALHPLRVESVAWAAERKDVLSALCGLLALQAYLRYVRYPGAGRYLAALALFALGLMAKPMLVTLPFVFLLLDWWPLGRPVLHRAVPGEASPVVRAWWGLFREKAPFLALTLASSLVTLQAQTRDVLPMVTPGLGTRLGNAVISYALYLRSFVWPARLACLYPYPQEGNPWWIISAAGIVLAAISAATVFSARRHPCLPVGWCWYLGTLLPVIGLIQVGGQARSDRYTYLSMIGVTVALVWLVGARWPRPGKPRPFVVVALGVALMAFSVASFAYVRVWRTSLGLFEYTARVTSGNYLILNNLGAMLIDVGRNEEAVRVLRETVRVSPDHCNGIYNLGCALYHLRRYREARAAFKRALRCYEHKGHSAENIADTLLNLGNSQLMLGQYPEAERSFQSLLLVSPNYRDGQGRIRLGEARARQGKPFR